MSGPRRASRHGAPLGLKPLLLLVLLFTLGADRRPIVEDLTTALDGDRVLVSYRVARAFDEELLERILSGIPVEFRHRLEVVDKRRFWLVPDRVVARTILTSQVEFDSMTQSFGLSRSMEQRSHDGSAVPPAVEQRLRTEDVAVVEDWLTALHDIPVDDPARELPAGPLEVRIEVELGRRYVLLIFPATVSADARSALPGRD